MKKKIKIGRQCGRVNKQVNKHISTAFENFVTGCGWGPAKKRASDSKKEGGLRQRTARWPSGENILNWLKSKMNYARFETYLTTTIRFRKN